MTSDDLCFQTATEVIAAFNARTLSPVELMDAIIDRCERVNPSVSAFTYTFFDRAREQAREAEKAYAAGTARALEGVPCVIKDLHPVEGEITTWGSRVYEGVPADYTVPTVQRLFDAGIIMHARSTTSEFAHTGHGHSPLWGVTRNPWNLELSPGGSSAGAGTSVCAGLTTIADGTDGGGSVRIPASACGVFGYKPPFGRNPVNLIATNWEPILHFGPITRSVADGALMQNVMSGQHVDDITTLRETVVLPERFESFRGAKVAVSMDLGYFEVDEEVQKNTQAAFEVFESELGCTVTEVDLGWTYSAYDAWVTHWQGLFSAIAGHYLPRWQYEMDPVVVNLLKTGDTHSAARVRQIEFVATDMYRTLGPILEEHDVLLCPTLAVAANGGRTWRRRHRFHHQRQAGRCHAAMGNDLSLQPGQPMPRRKRAERLREQRRTHRPSDRGAHLRRPDGVPRCGCLRGGPGPGGARGRRSEWTAARCCLRNGARGILGAAIKGS